MSCQHSGACNCPPEAVFLDRLDRLERKEANTIIRGGFASFALRLPQNQKQLSVSHREYLVQNMRHYAKHGVLLGRRFR